MESAFAAELAQVVNRERIKWNVPGIAVGILKDGKIETAGYGVTSLETGWSVTPDTLFEIGSNSKVFTTTLLMTLVDEGKVDLDELVKTYLPDLKLMDMTVLDELKVKHLVSHQSGLWGDVFDDYGWGDDALKLSVDAIVNVPHMYRPTEVWAYTNIAYNIAGRIIEVLLEQPFEDAMRERVLKPLGLERTFYFAHEVFPYPHGVGHGPAKPGDDDVIVMRDYWLNRALNPAGGLHGTVEDILKFDLYHMNGGEPGILSEESRLKMQEPQIEVPNFSGEWCLGWRSRTVQGVRLFEHGGGTNGFITANMAIPEKGVAIAIYTNCAYGGSAIQGINSWLLEHVAGLKEDRPEPIEVSDADLERFAGEYENPSTRMKVTVEAGKLKVETSMANITSDEVLKFPPTYYQPIDETRFIGIEGRDEWSRLDFVLNEDGSIRFIRPGGRVAAPVKQG
jgi:CubicO group peptidase (beta-lactamase class C family)